MFSYLIDKKKHRIFPHILQYYSSSLRSLVERALFNEAPTSKIRNVL